MAVMTARTGTTLVGTSWARSASGLPVIARRNSEGLGVGERVPGHHSAYFSSPPRNPPPIPPVISHTIAPIMSTHGSANSR